MNRNDMYDTFDDEKFDYHYPITFERRNKDYLKSKNRPDTSWKYGDNIEITFNLTAKDEEGTITPEYFDNKEVVIDFFNFRKEIILEKIFVKNDISEDYTVTVRIPSSVSKKIFTRGLYECNLKLINEEEDTQETVLDNYSIYVK